MNPSGKDIEHFQGITAYQLLEYGLAVGFCIALTWLAIKIINRLIDLDE